jgi:uncharacterized protein
MEKVTMVLGASPNPERVSYDAIISLQIKNIPVIAIGKKEYDLGYIKILKEIPQDIGSVHTIALYMSSVHQKEYYERILSLQPKRIIFNPGTQNPELEDLARANGIEVVDGCLLVMLKTGQF